MEKPKKNQSIKQNEYMSTFNRAADQRLCFRYIQSTIPLLSKSAISSLLPSSVAVQTGFCWTWSETPKTGFLSLSGSDFLPYNIWYLEAYEFIGLFWLCPRLHYQKKKRESNDQELTQSETRSYPRNQYGKQPRPQIRDITKITKLHQIYIQVIAFCGTLNITYYQIN